MGGVAVAAAIGGASIASSRSAARRAGNMANQQAEAEGQYQQQQIAQQEQQLQIQQEAQQAQIAQLEAQNEFQRQQIEIGGSNALTARLQFEEGVKRAEANETRAEEALNRSLRKKPNSSSILSAARQAGRTGASSTLLTGTKGVDKSQLSLGKSTLLGT